MCYMLYTPANFHLGWLARSTKEELFSKYDIFTEGCNGAWTLTNDVTIF